MNIHLGGARSSVPASVLTSLSLVPQAQRDYFGAHTYELVAKPGQVIHTNWTGHGGSVSSSSYNA